MNRIRNIKDLADLAGVSAGTVSRALTGSGLISSKTRNKIQALADEHGFRPNVMARNLRIQRTGAIGVLIPVGYQAGQHISDPFVMTMLGYLADTLTARGYDLVLSRIMPADSQWLDRFVDSGRVDGLIVIGQADQMTTLDRVAARYRPLVVWGGHSQGQAHCSVGSDNRLGGDLATSHLIEQGCQRIAFFGDPTALEISQRLDGCRDAMSRAGLADRLTVVPTDFVAEAAHDEIDCFLASAAQPPQGIVAASDVIAMSALQVLAEHDLRVPADVRVMGYDGLAISGQTVPGLSTIAQDLKHGAEALVDLLLRRIAGEETASVVMEPMLVERLSA